MKRLQKLVSRFVTGHPYFSSYLGGIIYYGVAVMWLKDVRTSDLVHDNSIARIIGLTAYLVSVLSFAVALPICLLIYRSLNIKLNRLSVLWLAPAIFVIGELGHSVLFSLVSLGSGGRVGDYWNFGSVGSYLINTPLVYASRIGGLSILSLIVAGIITALAFGLKNRKWLPFFTVVSCSCLLSFIGWQAYKVPNGPSIDVVAISIAVKAEGGSQIRKILEPLPDRSTDLVILPEHSNYWQYDHASQSKTTQRLMKSADSLIIGSAKNYKQSKTTNNIQFTSKDGDILFSQDKWFLVPGGEFVPYIYQAMLTVAGQRHLIDVFNSTRRIVPAADREQVFKRGNIVFGALACSGVNVMSLYRNLARSGATILSNSASVGILGGSEGYSVQSSNLAKLQAIANSRPFVQSARGGSGFIYDHNGNLVAKTDFNTNSVIQKTMQTNSKRTLYTILGDWIIWSAFVVVVFEALRRK